MHEQMGRIERAHRTIGSLVKSWLVAASLPKTLWYKASCSAVHVLNRIHTSTNSMTPYEARYRVKSSLKHLRVFGCLAYTHIPKEKRNKLERQGRPGLFVGYFEEGEGYEFYDLEQGKFFVEESAQFWEDTFPGEELKDQLEEHMTTHDDFHSYEDDSFESEGGYMTGSEDIDEIQVEAEVENQDYNFDDHDHNNLYNADEQSAIEENRGGEEKEIENTEGLRRSTRERRKPDRYSPMLGGDDLEDAHPKGGWGFGRFFVASDGEKSLNFTQARASEDWRDYKLAMIDFLKYLHRCGGFTVTSRPKKLVNILG